MQWVSRKNSGSKVAALLGFLPDILIVSAMRAQKLDKIGIKSATYRCWKILQSCTRRRLAHPRDGCFPTTFRDGIDAALQDGRNVRPEEFGADNPESH